MPALLSAVFSLLFAGAIARAAPSTTRDDCAAHYTSRAGDTCGSVGFKFGVSPGAIYGANTYLEYVFRCEYLRLEARSERSLQLQ